MSTALEWDYRRVVRVNASVHALYAEMDSVEGLVRFMPQIDDHQPTDDDAQAATIHGCIGLGPVSYRLTGSLTIDRADPPRRLRVRLQAPSRQLEIEGGFAFTPVSVEETAVEYAATVRCAHPLVRRMRSALIGVLEEHVDAATDLAAVRGRQYVQAAQLFSPDLRPGDAP